MRLPDFKLERYFAQNAAPADHLLCASDCEPFTVDELMALCGDPIEAFRALSLAYPPNEGMACLRREIAATYDNIEEEHVLVTTGASEALFATFNALLEPGDRVIVQQPCYQSLQQVPQAIGCNVAPWVARPENGWRFDIAELRELLKLDTKLLVMNSPHNPTGKLWSRRDWQHIIDLCSDHGVRVLSDEVYRGLEHEAGATLPAACDLDEAAVSIGDVSKAFGLAGLRIGWVACRDPSVVARILAFKDYTTIMASAPAQWLTANALAAKEAILARNLEIVRTNKAILSDFLAQDGTWSWIEPEAGTTVLIHTGSEGEGHADILLRNGIMVLPGPIMGLPDAIVRLGLGRRNLADGLAQVRTVLRHD